jgi:uncharacterized membrane protein YhaH (DUF805 family)
MNNNILNLINPSYLNNGRMGRLNFFISLLIVFFGTFITLDILIYAAPTPFLMVPVAIVGLIYYAQIITRRLHDTGQSGSIGFIGFIPGIAGLLLIYLCFKKGSTEKNEFGHPVKISAGVIDVLCNSPEIYTKG